MSYPFAPKMQKTILDSCIHDKLKFIKYIFEDQYNHLVNPTVDIAKKIIFDGLITKAQNVIVAKPGSGKTTVFLVDLIWRIAALAKEGNINNQLVMITSPDDTINQENIQLLNTLFNDNDFYDNLSKFLNLNFIGIYSEPKEVKGRGLEILVCSIQKATGDQHKYLKNHKILLIVSDEAHRGLGCPSRPTYTKDVGHSGSGYNAVWFNQIRELDYHLWIGMTGTETHSMNTNKQFYNVISDKMEKAEWRLPFFDKSVYHTDDQKLLVKSTFLEIAKRNAINKYYKDKIDFKNLSGQTKDTLSKTKVTGIIKCGQDRGLDSLWLTVEEVKDLWDSLKEFYKDETFEFEGKTLKYHIGELAVLTSEEKTGGSNSRCVNLLNSESNNYVAVAVIQIGTVAINITNLGVGCIIPKLSNLGDVDNNIQQFIARMDRCRHIWRGVFSSEVAKVNNSEQRNLIIKLAVNSSNRKLFMNYSSLVKDAYFKVADNHILTENAEGYLKGLVSMERVNSGVSTISGKDRDLAYKNARKTRCEFKGCSCYDDLVINSKHKTKSERELAYQKILQVDHIDGDRENMKKENLITLCPNRHSIKTYDNKDYLNRYLT